VLAPTLIRTYAIAAFYIARNIFGLREQDTGLDRLPAYNAALMSHLWHSRFTDVYTVFCDRRARTLLLERQSNAARVAPVAVWFLLDSASRRALFRLWTVHARNASPRTPLRFAQRAGALMDAFLLVRVDARCSSTALRFLIVHGLDTFSWRFITDGNGSTFSDNMYAFLIARTAGGLASWHHVVLLAPRARALPSVALDLDSACITRMDA